MVGCFFYSYILTTFLSLFKIQNKYLQIYYEKKEILTDIKKKFRLNENLYKIINRNLYLSYKKGGVEKKDFLVSLPSIIKNELIFKLYSKIILKLDFFKEILKNKELLVNVNDKYNISKSTLISKNTFNSTNYDNRTTDIKRVVHTEEFITVVVPMLHRYVYHKGEQVWAFNQLVDEMFMIENGKVDFCLGYEYHNYSIGHLKKNKHYGEVVMFSDEQTSPFDVIVVSKLAEIFTLGQKEFHHLRETFPLVVEKLLAKSVKNHLEVETLRTVAIEYYSINLTFDGLRSLINAIVKDDISNYLSVIEQEDGKTNNKMELLESVSESELDKNSSSYESSSSSEEMKINVVSASASSNIDNINQIRNSSIINRSFNNSFNKSIENNSKIINYSQPQIKSNKRPTIKKKAISN